MFDVCVPSPQKDWKHKARVRVAEAMQSQSFGQLWGSVSRNVAQQKLCGEEKSFVVGRKKLYSGEEKSFVVGRKKAL